MNTSSLYTRVFSAKMTEIITFQQFQTKKKGKYIIGEIKASLRKIKIFKVIHYIFWFVTFFIPGVNLLILFSETYAKVGLRLVEKWLHLAFFSKKEGRCSKLNLNVILLKILPCTQGCLQIKNYRNGYISAISEEKKASMHTFEKKSFTSENYKFYEVINSLFRIETFFFSRVNLPIFFSKTAETVAQRLEEKWLHLAFFCENKMTI